MKLGYLKTVESALGKAENLPQLNIYTYLRVDGDRLKRFCAKELEKVKEITEYKTTNSMKREG